MCLVKHSFCIFFLLLFWLVRVPETHAARDFGRTDADTLKEDNPMFKKMILSVLTNTLHRAAQAGDAKKVRALIAKGHDVNGLDKNSISPLFWAAFSKDLAVAQALVDHGADVNFTGPNGTTPLYNALHKRNEELALWLLDKGANPLAADTNGNTMLHLASLQSLVPVVDRLIPQGADVNALNANGQSPLTLNLIVQRKLSPVSASPVCALRLMEAGAAYEPVPWLDESPMEFFAECATAGSTFREELRKFAGKTANEALRGFVETALEQAEPDSVPDASSDTSEAASASGGVDPFYADLRRYEKQMEEPRSIQSPVLGTMVREEYDFWVSQPVAVPFYNNEMIPITYDFDLKEDPTFLAEADRAVTAFLKLDDAFRLSLSKQVAEFAVLNLEAWDYSGYEAKDEYAWVGLRDMSIDEQWLNEFVAGAKTPEDVWRMVGSPVDVYAARASGANAVYVAIRWNCLWDVEHQFQLSFREGRTLARISAHDGDLAD